MKRGLSLIAAALVSSLAFGMNHNLAWPWGNPPRCSPPQSPLFAFYNRANTTMLFDGGDEIEIYCQAQVRPGSGLSWTLAHNMVVKPFLAGEAEDLPANLFRIVIPTKDLAPGFYDLHVKLEGIGYKRLDLFARRPRDGKGDVKVQSVPPEGMCTFGWKPEEMALPAPEYRPADFRAFWDKAYGDYCAKVPLDARVESPALTFDAKAVETYNVTNACLPPCFDPKGVKYDEVVSYKVSWAGPDGGRVYANLARPKAEGRYPAMLVLPGAGTGPRPRPLDHARHGYVAIDVQVHGLDTDITNGYRIAGYPGGGPSKWADHAPEHCCWYPIYLRAARGVDYLASLPFVDASRIVCCGGSQGGRLSSCVPAIDRRVAATIPAIAHGANEPYLWWFKRQNGFARPEDRMRDPALVPGDGHAGFVDAVKPVDDPAFEQYRYFDPMNFAPDVTCPVYMNLGLMDPCSYAPGVWAIYTRMASADKTLVPIAGHAHDWFPAFDRAAYRWLARTLRTPAEWADTRVGSSVAGLGSCMPGPCVPHGSVYPSPDTVWPSPSMPHCATSGYHQGDPVVGFSQLHTQGTGGHPSYGHFLVSPILGSGLGNTWNPVCLDEVGMMSHIELRETRPYLFRGRLVKWKTDVAISASSHAAVYAFDFPAHKDARIVFNLVRKLRMFNACSNFTCTVDAKTGEITGGGTYFGNWCPGSFACWFYAKCDRVPQAAERTEKGAWFSFDTKADRRVRMKVGVSFRSPEKAKEYAEREIEGFDVAAAAASAKALWEDRLGAVRVEGLSEKDQRLFYSHLFHAFVQPRDRTGDIDVWPEDEPVWDDHYTLWDTWKTLFPLMSLLDPAMVAGNVNSFAARSERSGFVGVGFCMGREYRVGQAGDESDNIMADAFAKKIPGIDWPRAWAAMKRHAAHRTPEYRELGYVPFGVPVEYCWRMKSGSSTLGFAYNDWCCAQVAKGLGHDAEAAALLARSHNWTNVWDASLVDAPSGYRGFCRGRFPDGRFTDVIAREGCQNPNGREYFGDFYEGSCWEYSYMIPGDIPGMIERMGGERLFTERLAYAFDNGLIDYGNEPSFITAWLFDFVGRGDLASKWAHVFRRQFEEKEIPGDDDSGAMGSMYVFLTAGIFPIGGQDLYALHAPAARRISLTLPQSGKTLTIVSRLPLDGSRFGEVYLNGVRLEKPLVRHAQILAGGTLEFR